MNNIKLLPRQIALYPNTTVLRHIRVCSCTASRGPSGGVCGGCGGAIPLMNESKGCPFDEECFNPNK